MGWFFSNLHINKTSELDTNVFLSLLTEVLSAQGFQQKNDPKESDFSVSVFDTGGKWVSLCSDGLDFYTEESIQTICNPLSERLSTDVLTVSCFDSDCLLLNRINRKLDVDAWVKIGNYPEFKVRSTPARWKDIVSDEALWKSVLKNKYVFAEEALVNIEPLLGLESGQGHFCDELISEKYAERVITCYFAIPESASKTQPPKLTLPTYDLMPCKNGENHCCFVVNTGRKTKGVAIVFSGSYVEHEEIRFRDVSLEYALDQYPRKTIPLQLEKRKTQTGQWIYYAELPDFPIREGVKEGLPWKRKSDEELKRVFGVRFTPEGNPRKMLDITIHFVPLKNPKGQCGWCVWWHSGSKRAYIEEYNRIWSKNNYSSNVELYNIDDFDLDE